MAYYEHLPIYKSALDLCIYFEKIVVGFDRNHKYIIGADLRRLSIKAVMLILKTNDAKDKISFLLELKNVLEEIKILIKICKEINVFNNFKSFEVSITLLDSIIKQCVGWLNSQKQPGQNWLFNDQESHDYPVFVSPKVHMIIIILYLKDHFIC